MRLIDEKFLIIYNNHLKKKETMKKTYQQPTVKTVLVKMNNLMQTISNVGVSANDYNSGTKLSRRGGGSWDEDEEEY